MRIREGGQTSRFYVDGGFVEVSDNIVSVLTSRAIPADKLDAAVAAEQLTTARGRPSNTPELMEIRDRLVAQSRSQLRLAKKR
jgi:F-type H+-transporting ATPase subunit epsilon